MINMAAWPQLVQFALSSASFTGRPHSNSRYRSRQLLPTGIRKLNEQYYDAGNNIHTQTIRTGICKATDIKPGNNHL
jgi:hypothetical protein